MDRKFRKKQKKSVMRILAGVLIIGVIVTGINSSGAEKQVTLGELMLTHLEKEIYEKVLKTYLPALTYEYGEEREYFKKELPIYSYIRNS